MYSKLKVCNLYPVRRLVPFSRYRPTRSSV